MIIGNTDATPKIILKKNEGSIYFDDDTSLSGNLTVFKKETREVTIYSKKLDVLSKFKASADYFAIRQSSVDGKYIYDGNGIWEVSEKGVLKSVFPVREFGFNNVEFLGKSGFFYGQKFDLETKSYGYGGFFNMKGEEILKNVRKFKYDPINDRYIVFHYENSNPVPTYSLLDKDFNIILGGCSTLSFSGNFKIVSYRKGDSVRFLDTKINELYFDDEIISNKLLTDEFFSLPATDGTGNISALWLNDEFGKPVSYLYDENLKIIGGPFLGRIEKVFGKKLLVRNNYNGNSNVKSFYELQGTELKLEYELDTKYHDVNNFGGLSTYIIQDTKGLAIFGYDGTKLLPDFCSNKDTSTFFTHNDGSANRFDFSRGIVTKKSKDGTYSIYSAYDLLKNININGRLVTLTECEGSPNDIPDRKFLLKDGDISGISSVKTLENIGLEIDTIDNNTVKVGGKILKRSVLKI